MSSTFCIPYSLLVVCLKLRSRVEGKDCLMNLQLLGGRVCTFDDPGSSIIILCCKELFELARIVLTANKLITIQENLKVMLRILVYIRFGIKFNWK